MEILALSWFYSFTAFLLLFFVSLSAPTWEKISFLNAHVGGREIHFGAYGYTGTGTSIGYRIDPAVLGIHNGCLDSPYIQILNNALVVHSVAASYSGLATIIGLFGLCDCLRPRSARTGTGFIALFALQGMILTLPAWIFDMVLWGVVRNCVRDNGGVAEYGNANWMTLGAFVALALAFCNGACRRHGRALRRSERTSLLH